MKWFKILIFSQVSTSYFFDFSGPRICSFGFSQNPPSIIRSEHAAYFSKAWCYLISSSRPYLINFIRIHCSFFIIPMTKLVFSKLIFAWFTRIYLVMLPHKSLSSLQWWLFLTLEHSWVWLGNLRIVGAQTTFMGSNCMPDMHCQHMTFLIMDISDMKSCMQDVFFKIRAN